jgi:valyl-tRNA synthetase
MQRRLEDWINGLKWDWNISRQRHYGVPFPVWVCGDCQRPILADLAALPVDPLADPPPVNACPDCGATTIVADPDVMDTWMTSSLSPQVNDGWALHALPDGHRRWAARAGIPNIEPVVLAWCGPSSTSSASLDDGDDLRLGTEQQGKNRKRDLDQSTTADGFNHIRTTSSTSTERTHSDCGTKARIGNDCATTRKTSAPAQFTVKLWNVARFIQLNLDGDGPPAIDLRVEDRTAVDRWLLSHLADTVTEVTAALDERLHAGPPGSVAVLLVSAVTGTSRWLGPVHQVAERSFATGTARISLWESFG